MNINFERFPWGVRYSTSDVVISRQGFCVFTDNCLPERVLAPRFGQPVAHLVYMLAHEYGTDTVAIDEHSIQVHFDKSKLLKEYWLQSDDDMVRTALQKLYDEQHPKLTFAEDLRHRSFPTGPRMTEAKSLLFIPNDRNQLEQIARDFGQPLATMIRKLFQPWLNVGVVIVEPFKIDVYLDLKKEPFWDFRVDTIIREAIDATFAANYKPARGVVRNVIEESVHNRAIRDYHTSFIVSNSSHSSFSRHYQEWSRKDLDEVGHPGAELIDMLLRIDGVTEVTPINPYCMRVHVAKLFEGAWTTTADKVEEAFKSIYGQSLTFQKKGA